MYCFPPRIAIWPCLILLLSLALPLRTVSAQSPLDILVIVGTTPVTRLDVETRLALLEVLGEAPSDPTRAQALVLDSLIDEALVAAAATAQNLYPSPENLEQIFANIAANNALSTEEFALLLSNSSIDVAAFRERLEAQLAWNNLRTQRLGRQADVEGEELEAAWEAMQAAAGQIERRLSQVYLKDLTINEASAVAGDMVTTGNFAAIAQAFSKAPSAAQGGDMGWVRQDSLGPEIEAALAELKAGEVSLPIPFQDGYLIFAVEAIRPVGALEVRELFDLARLTITLESRGQSTADKEKLVTLDQVFRRIDSCERFEQALAIYGEDGSGRLEAVMLADLPPEVRTVVRELELNAFSQLIPTQDGAAIYMKCAMIEEVVPMDRAQLRAQLTQEKSARLEARLRRSLRRAAYIDTYIDTPLDAYIDTSIEAHTDTSIEAHTDTDTDIDADSDGHIDRG